jgi:hypothetical protein
MALTYFLSSRWELEVAGRELVLQQSAQAVNHEYKGGRGMYGGGW